MWYKVETPDDYPAEGEYLVETYDGEHFVADMNMDGIWVINGCNFSDQVCKYMEIEADQEEDIVDQGRGKDIEEYLENSYSGAEMMDDPELMLRISRAVAAFRADPEEDIFTEKFTEEYISR